MFFILLLIISALSISSVAAYFSIYGLASIFTGSFYPVVIMGIVLEAGKLIAASYVYRFWEKINFLLKTYLISAIFTLMIITSTGIFGFLSASYQEDTLPLKEMNELISLLETEKDELIFRKRQIDEDIASLPSNYISGRQKLMKSYGPELNKINTRIDDITIEINKISKSKIQQESHAGPVIYIAKVFNKEIDDAIKYMILMLIFVFDPLAIILVICANIAIKIHKNHKPEFARIDEHGNIDKDIEMAIRNIISKKEIIKNIRNKNKDL